MRMTILTLALVVLGVALSETSSASRDQIVKSSSQTDVAMGSEQGFACSIKSAVALVKNTNGVGSQTNGVENPYDDNGTAR